MRCLHWTPCNHQRSGVRFTVASRAVLECLQSIAALWPTDSASMILAACNCTLPTAGPPVQQRGRAGSRGRAASARAHATALLRRPPAAALQTGHRMAARASHFSTCGRATRTNPADACCTLACVEQRACWQRRMARPSGTACAVTALPLSHVKCHCCRLAERSAHLWCQLGAQSP